MSSAESSDSQNPDLQVSPVAAASAVDSPQAAVSPAPAGEPDLDQIMAQIEELQKQIAKMAVPERPSIISKKILASLAQAVHPSKIPGAAPGTAGVTQGSGQSTGGEAGAVSSESGATATLAPALPPDSVQSSSAPVLDTPINASSVAQESADSNPPAAVIPVLPAQEPRLSEQVNEIFKDIQGGESGLVAETLANLPGVVPEKTAPELEAPVKEIRSAVSPSSTPLESESLLAAMLKPAEEESAPSPFAADLGSSQIHQAVHEILQSPAEEAPPAPSKKSTSNPRAAEQLLTMTVTGQMSLKLNFEYGGQEVLVRFHAEMIYIQFSDGSEFKIPVRRSVLRQVA